MYETIYRCPKCKLPLTAGDSCAKCPTNHSFDRAASGYFNLLISPPAGTHGDNKEMVASRRDFLDAGYYGFLSDEINRLAEAYLPSGGVVLDGGCGEGYYTDALQKRLCLRGIDSPIFGFDISKDAVKAASKRNKSLHLSVAGVYDMPFLDESVDLVLNLFAPFAGDEIRRVLRSGGVLLMAVPGRDHLFGMKEILYEHPYRNEVSEQIPDGFCELEQTELKQTAVIRSSEHIRALFGMTPYAYRTPREGRERLFALRELETPLHFRVFAYRKKGG